MNSGFEFKTSEQSPNNEATRITSGKNKDESKFSRGKSLNKSTTGAVKYTCTSQNTQNGKMFNTFYTEKFERMLQENYISENSESVSYENMESSSKDNYIVNNSLDSRTNNNSKDEEHSRESSTSKVYPYNTEGSSMFSAKELPNKTSDLTTAANLLVGNKVLEGTNNINQVYECETNLDEEYDIFKSGPTGNVNGVNGNPCTLVNEQEQSGGDPKSGSFNSVKNKLHLENGRSLENKDDNVSRSTDQNHKRKCRDDVSGRQNCTVDNTVKRQNVRNNVRSPLITASKSGSSTSKDKANIYSKRGGGEGIAKRPTENEQNNTENTRSTEISSMEDDAKLYTENIEKELPKQTMKTNKNTTKVKKQKNDLTKRTLLKMIKAVRNRRERIKYRMS